MDNLVMNVMNVILVIVCYLMLYYNKAKLDNFIREIHVRNEKHNINVLYIIIKRIAPSPPGSYNTIKE